jgi:hypothetical protein
MRQMEGSRYPPRPILREQLGRRAPPGLILEIDIGFMDREESRRTVHRPAPMPPVGQLIERLLTTQDFARHRIGVAAEPRPRVVAFLPP